MILKLLLAGPAVLFTALFTTNALTSQSAPTPPMKMGLWESTATSTVSMTGMQMPPSAGGPHVIKMRRCVTPETWASNFQSSQSQGCQRSNESFSAGHYSTDLSCPNMKGSGHVDMNFTSTDSGHGTVHLELDSGGHHIVVDSVVDMHYVSASCGAIAPDHPQIVQ